MGKVYKTIYLSIIISLFLTFVWYNITGAIMSFSALAVIATLSFMGLIIIVLSHLFLTYLLTSSRTGEILADNVEYVDELGHVMEYATLALLASTTVSVVSILLRWYTPSISTVAVATFVNGVILLFILIANVQVLYDDFIDLDVKSKKSKG